MMSQVTTSPILTIPFRVIFGKQPKTDENILKRLLYMHLYDMQERGGKGEKRERFAITSPKSFHSLFGEYLFVSICRVGIATKVVTELSLHADFDDVRRVCNRHGQYPRGTSRQNPDKYRRLVGLFILCGERERNNNLLTFPYYQTSLEDEHIISCIAFTC